MSVIAHFLEFQGKHNFKFKINVEISLPSCEYYISHPENKFDKLYYYVNEKEKISFELASTVVNRL